MNTRKTTLRRWGHFALTPLALAMAWTGAVHGAEYWLCAKSGSINMPGASITIWGYVEDDDANLANGCPALDSTTWTAALPALHVLSSDVDGLTVHLRNDLPEPTSIIIPGQGMPSDGATTPTTLTPIMFPADAQGRQRVRSFTAEAATEGGTQTYNWADLKPGTYLYHSGTHPQVQVQMGLYGAVTHDAATGQAYAGVPYASEATLLFSEIDPVLHAAVAAGQYGPNLQVSSTIDYAPQYFLINGKPYTDPSPSLATGAAGQTTLLRLLNAGLQTRSPVLQGMHMRLVAEDGKPYPYAREQYSVFLPALKTVDAVINPTGTADASYPIYDRRLATINPSGSGSTNGGMLAFLTVTGATATTPVATSDGPYTTAEDTFLAVPAPGVLSNDTGGGLSTVLVSGTTHGSLSLAANGGFNYSPAANYNGSDGFSYKARNSSGDSSTVTVSLDVIAVNDAPVAANDAYSMLAGATLNVAAPGVLGNDSDAEGDLITAENPSVLAGLSFNADGSFSYAAPATGGSYSFTYQARDPAGATSPAATVTLTVIANQPPVAVDDTVSTPRNTPLTINVLANDSDPDGNLLPATVTIVTPPNKGGTANVVGNGSNTVSISYTPKTNFRGTENFTYQVSDSLGATLYTSTKSTTDSRAIVKVNVK